MIFCMILFTFLDHIKIADCLRSESYSIVMWKQPQSCNIPWVIYWNKWAGESRSLTANRRLWAIFDICAPLSMERAHYGGITLVLAPNRVAEELETIAKKAHFMVWLLYKQNYCKGHQGNLFLQHKYNLDNREVTGRSLCGFDTETWSKIAVVKMTLEQKAVTPHSGNKWSFLRILLKTEWKDTSYYTAVWTKSQTF